MHKLSLVLLNCNHLSILSPVVLVIVHSLSCSSDQLYLKVVKQSRAKASEESFSIRSDSTLYFTSPTYFNNELATHELCVPQNVNNLYLIMHDSNGDSWSSGSWIEVRKGNNEFILNTVMTEMYDERVIIISTETAAPTIQCQENQEYMKIVFSKNDYGDSNSYQITDGSTVLYSSGYMYYPNTYTIDICVTITPNYQYTLVMRNSYGNGWGNDWIEIYNKMNERVVYATMEQWAVQQQVNFVLLTSLPVQTICSDGKIYLKITKKTDSSGIDESFQIQSDNDVLYSSTIAEVGTTRNYFVCLPPSTDLQYSLTMLDTDGTWSGGSWIELRSVNNNLVLKSFMTTQSEQTVPFSLSTPIPKGAKWYFRSIYQQDWYRSSFESNVWTMTTFASTTTTSGTVYYYKPFHGVENMSAVETVFRYRYGIIAYLNGFEIYRDKMPLGEVNRMTLSTDSYSSYDYRGVIRPALFIHNDNKNHLAVEIHYPNSDLRSSIDFDAYLALLPGATGQNCYVYPYDISIQSSSSYMYSSSYAVDWSGATYAYSSSWNSISITFAFSTILPTISQMRMWYGADTNGFPSFSMRFSNTNLGNTSAIWQDVLSVSNTIYSANSWSMFNNNDSLMSTSLVEFNAGYNSYSFSIYELQFLICNAPETLTYSSFSFIFYLNQPVQNVGVTQNSTDCRISPSLPSGLTISDACVISGTPSSVSNTTVYSVMARVNNTIAIGTVMISVRTCENLVTIRVRGDAYPTQNAWSLFSGRYLNGTLIQSVDSLYVSNAYYNYDFCLDPGIYTFLALSLDGDGWEAKAGYTLTVDGGEMDVDIMEVSSPSVTSVFSTYFPFQIEYTDWKVIQSDVSSDWNTVSFDDSTWNTYKAVDIPSTSSITTYIRKSFTMSGVNDYQVLNVRVKYSGGVGAYLNGNLVARFNLEDDFDSTTLSITDHDSNVFSKFHVILSTSGIEEGTNVFSFEIHRGLNGSSSDAVVFDATGVFGV